MLDSKILKAWNEQCGYGGVVLPSPPEKYSSTPYKAKEKTEITINSGKTDFFFFHLYVFLSACPPPFVKKSRYKETEISEI